MNEEQQLFTGAQRAGLYDETASPAAPPPRYEAKAEDDSASARRGEEAPELATSTSPQAPGQAGRAAVAAPTEVRPAQWGWRGKVRRGTAGLVKLAPDEAELAHRRAVTTIRQATWPRAVNIVVANRKGGTGKTPAALILGGILGDVRGGYVGVWEAAESIGSLNRRAEGDPFRGLAELLEAVGDIRSAGNLGGYTAPQTSHADVIGSVGRRRSLTAADVLDLREVFDRYYRITVTDTGNHPAHEVFQAALRTADAVVLPCLVSIDALDGVEEALAVMYDAGGHVSGRGGLVERVVVILGHDGGPEDPDVAAAVRSRLAELGVAAVLEVPFDPAIRIGGEITVAALREESRRAWTATAAAVVTALRTAPTGTDLVQQERQRLRLRGLADQVDQAGQLEQVALSGGVGQVDRTFDVTHPATTPSTAPSTAGSAGSGGTDQV